MVPTNRSDQALSVAAATTTQTSPDILNPSGKGLILFVDVSASGVLQQETATAAGTITGNGNLVVIVTAAGMTGSPITLSVAVLNGDTPTAWATKVRTAMSGNANIAAWFTIGGTGTAIVLTKKIAAANDATMNIDIDNDTSTGATTAHSSANTTGGSIISLTPTIEMKDPISGNYIVLWSATAPLTAIGTKAYSFYPGASFSTTGFVEAIQTIISSIFRIKMAHSGTAPASYTVSYALMA